MRQVGPSQTNFDLNTFLPYRLNQVAEAVSHGFQPRYQQEFGLTRTQWRIMAHLAAQDGLSAKDIAARIHEDKVSISRGVSALVGKGFLSRSPNAQDRRFDELRLTVQGRDIFNTLARRAADYERELELLIGAAACAELHAILSVLLKKMAQDGQS